MPYLSNLTPVQTRALVRLDDGLSHLDSVGREAEGLSDALLVACYELAQIGLVEVTNGWRGTVWFRMTTKGRAVRETGRS